MEWCNLTKKKTNRGFVNLETYAIAAKEVKSGHQSVKKAANAYDINVIMLTLITN